MGVGVIKSCPGAMGVIRGIYERLDGALETGEMGYCISMGIAGVTGDDEGIPRSAEISSFPGSVGSCDEKFAGFLRRTVAGQKEEREEEKEADFHFLYFKMSDLLLTSVRKG